MSGAERSSASEVLMWRLGRRSVLRQCRTGVRPQSVGGSCEFGKAPSETASERRVKSVTLRIVIGLMARVLFLLLFLCLALQK